MSERLLPHFQPILLFAIYYMTKAITLFISLVHLAVCNAQTSAYQIKVKLSNYKYDTVFLAYQFGDKKYIKDTGLVKNEIVIFEGKEKLEKGVYLLVRQTTKDFVEFLVDDNKQQISFELDFDSPKEIKVTRGSQASADLFAYTKFLASKRTVYEALLKQLKEAGTNEANKKKIQLQIDNIVTVVKQYQKEYIQKNPASLLALIIKINLPYEPPVFSGSKEETEMKNWQWYKAHWFDNASISDPRMLRTDLLVKKVDYYLDTLIALHPDSIILSVDEILERTKPSPESYKFFLVKLVNKYAKEEFVGMDAVFVHIALKYLATGKFPWIDDNQLKKMLDKARRLEPILIGKKAPDIEVETLSGGTISLWNFDAAYTILFFWSNDCSHCKESIPALLEAEKQYRNKEVKVFTVCADTGSDVAKGCREFIQTNKMSELFNTMDPNMLSNFKGKYVIDVTPQLFILDKNKVIVSKKIATDQLKQVLDNLLNKQ